MIYANISNRHNKKINICTILLGSYNNQAN